MIFKQNFVEHIKEYGIIKTIIVYLIAFILMVMLLPILFIEYHSNKKSSKKPESLEKPQDTLLEQFIKELIKRKIDFVLCFQGTYGGWIENVPNEVDTFLIFFDCENDVYSFTVANRKITTMEELLKIKLFTTD